MSIESEIAKLVGTMALAFPSAQMGAENIKVYVGMLKDIPLELLTPAVQQCMAESDFLPSVAKIREKALTLSSPVAPEPLEAWGIVIKEMERTGFYKSPQFDDALIAKAVDCMGWQTLCSSENQVADRVHFAKVYEGLVKQAENERRLVPQARQIKEQLAKMLES